MQSLQPDPATGFLEVQTKKINSFDANKKLQILQAISEFVDQGKWPGIHKICRGLNVSPSAFYEHLDIDPEFKAAYDDAMLALEDSLVGNLVKQGQGANGVTANIFLLKNRWAKRWNEDYWLNFRGDSVQLKGLLTQTTPFIDAEIVPNDK